MLSVISYIKAPTDLSDGSGWCGWNITVCRGDGKINEEPCFAKHDSS